MSTFLHRIYARSKHIKIDAFSHIHLMIHMCICQSCTVGSISGNGNKMYCVLSENRFTSTFPSNCDTHSIPLEILFVTLVVALELFLLHTIATIVNSSRFLREREMKHANDICKIVNSKLVSFILILIQLIC